MNITLPVGRLFRASKDRRGRRKDDQRTRLSTALRKRRERCGIGAVQCWDTRMVEIMFREHVFTRPGEESGIGKERANRFSFPLRKDCTYI